MKKIIFVGFCLLSLIEFGWEGRDSTLLWQVNDDATVDGASMHYSFLVPYTEDDDNWNGIRVKVVSPDGQVQRILDIWGEEDGETVLWSGHDGMAIGDSYNFYGAGVPTGVQSPLNDINSLIAEEYYIQAELGRLSWNYDTDSADWNTLAYSDYEKLTYQFKEDHTYDLGTIAPPGESSWIPTEFYTINPAIPTPSVPEPSINLLLLIGSGVLLVKRKKHFQA